MKANVEVTDRAEGQLIKDGLDDEPTRALVKIMGALAQLDSVRSKLRVLNFVRDFFEEREFRARHGVQGERGPECPGAVGVETDAPQ